MKHLTILLALLAAAGMRAAPKPNIVLILADDLGFSDIGCYGGEIRTPNLDALAGKGLRFTQFYSAARCCPSRAALMTGLYPHQAQIGDMVDAYARPVREALDSPAYSDRLNPHAPTIAEALRAAGYRTGMSGKWHLGYRAGEWPVARGFDRSFAVIEGAMNYYGFGMQHTGMVTNPPMALDREVFLPPQEGFFATDAFTDHAVRFIREIASDRRPFFLYLAYTAPHWPLHARPDTIAKYRGSYRKIGWDNLRQERYRRLQQAGVVDPRWRLSPRPPGLPAWSDAAPERQDQWDEEMSVYAAQIDEMDQNIGRVLDALRETAQEENTLVMFLSDNGGAAENPNRGLPGAALGGRASYRGYGIAGAHVSSSPFRKTKKFTHEGGIAAPLIVCWPAGIDPLLRGKLAHAASHLIDILPTCLSAAGGSFPREWKGRAAVAPEGVSLAPLLIAGGGLSRSKPLFWEHEGHRAVREGKWKLVASSNEPWELYDMEADRTESSDLSSEQPKLVEDLAAKYEDWSRRVGVRPWPVPASNGVVMPRRPVAEAVADAMRFLRKADGAYVPGRADGELAGYFASAHVNPDGTRSSRKLSFPARHHAYFIFTFLRYHAYTGDREWLLRARDLADWNLARSTPAQAVYASVPYSTFYDGRPGGSRDQDAIEPDKSAFLGKAYLAVYEATADRKYLEAACAVARTLARQQREDGSWPFRVVPETGVIRQDFGGAPVFFVEFFEAMIRHQDAAECRRAHDRALQLMLERNARSGLWGTYHEDIVLKPETYLSAEPMSFTAGYLFRKAADRPEYLELGRAILRAMEGRLVYTNGHAAAPAPAVSEQAGFEHLMPGHTARYCRALAGLHAATGDAQARARALSGMNALTYMQSPPGLFRTFFASVNPGARTRDRPDWYSQHLYTVCHALESMAALPELAPAGQDHLLDSDVFVREIRYGRAEVQFETIAPSRAVLKLSFHPARIEAGSRVLPLSKGAGSAGSEGWWFEPSTGLLTIQHGAGRVTVRGAPGPSSEATIPSQPVLLHRAAM
ncbi:MAG TPA: sulfatase-like hydrolase/transferase [Candidatus Paceibacterota bacterium]|nr:sulfatase-like hydrolase/transferase [Verrucomicrobiota bacterium]HOX03957.1 sulfatase-like hydrolase/transferase [Verrucomicrobiota bacterium]HRZ46851.1 sulfatase-like hydrolase/transferase [Candidatus Paceibacterota bacterium]